MPSEVHSPAARTAARTAATAPGGAPLRSIGELAELTGHTIDTLRKWERRYGRPKPHRRPSGHRRYDEADFRWLCLVNEAVARGHRPGEVVTLPEHELVQLLGAADAHRDPRVDGMLAAIASSDAPGLRRMLEEACASLGHREWSVRVVAPLVSEIGRSWARGVIGARHEHLATEVLGSVLRREREAVLPAGAPPGVALATLPGEPHALGLLLVALHCALAGVECRLLGADLPALEIARGAEEARVGVLGISVSLAHHPGESATQLGEVRALLREDVRIVVGGLGATRIRELPENVLEMAKIADFEAWLREELGGDRA